MSTHHGHHRSHHSRSRIYHSSHHHSNHNRSRTSSSNNSLNNNHNSVSNRISHQSQASPSKEFNSEWQQHRSSSGKVYYYNNKTGLSQWEVPAELRQQQQQQNHNHHQPQQHQHHQQHQHQQQQQQHHQIHLQQQQQQHQPTAASPESEISESSSIRQQQDKSPSSSASSHASARSNSIPEDKPLLTPSLAQYFRPELISNPNSSRLEEPERLANQYSREASELSERILSVSVDLKIARSMVQFVETSLEAQEKKYSILRNTIDKYFPQ